MDGDVIYYKQMLVKGLCSATCFCCIRSPMYSFCPWYMVFMKKYYYGTVKKYDECPNIYKLNPQVSFSLCNGILQYRNFICMWYLYNTASCH